EIFTSDRGSLGVILIVPSSSIVPENLATVWENANVTQPSKRLVSIVISVIIPHTPESPRHLPDRASTPIAGPTLGLGNAAVDFTSGPGGAGLVGDIGLGAATVGSGREGIAASGDEP